MKKMTHNFYNLQSDKDVIKSVQSMMKRVPKECEPFKEMEKTSYPTLWMVIKWQI